MEDALELARQAYRCGVDAFIVQDIGIALELRRILPDCEVHVSTQMNTHTEDGIQAAAALGASRVTLARELSFEEIAQLSQVARDLGMEVEVFAHGALCICYSGQCFMSSMVGGRSANRGRCAQACRLPYTLHNVALRKTLDAPGEHLLSPKDLCTIDVLPELIEAGATSLKIEGRMKSPEYVKSVVGVYRQVLDRALAWISEARRAELDCGSVELSGDPINPRATDAEHQILSEAFSRGFTTAYLEGQRGNEIMSYGRPNNRGVFVGRVVRAKEGKVTLDTETELHVGDAIEFWTNRGHFVHTIDGFENTKESSRSGKVTLSVERAVGKGDRVFRVRNAEAAFIDANASKELEEAALMDGANLLQQIWYVELPAIKNIIVIQFILQAGNIMSIGFEKAYALQTDMNLPASEILSTYVYRIGLLNGDYGYSTAVGLFNSVVNVILLIFVNWVVKKLNDGEGL